MSIQDIPLASGATHCRVFQKLGWVVRARGNHIVLENSSSLGMNLSIPNHKEVSRPLIKKLIKLAGLTDEEYRRAFDRL